MECYYRSNPIDQNGIPIKGYKQRMHREWRERGPFQVTEQRICDQARAIRKNGWLTDMELEIIRSNVCAPRRTSDEDVDDEVEMAQELTQDPSEEPETRPQLTVNLNEATDENREIVNQIREFYNSNENSDCIVFKKFEYKKLKTVNRLNKVLHYFETSDITETNNLIKACSVWVYKELGLKKVKTNLKKKPDPWFLKENRREHH